MKFTILSALALFALPLPQARSVEPDWRIGLAVAKITPEKPALMAGYASRVKPSGGVVMDIYAKALAIQDSGGQRALLITTDLIGITAEVGDPVCERIREQTGLRREEIILSWAHNHAGPSLSLKVNYLGYFPSASVLNEGGYETRGLFSGKGWFAPEAQGVLVKKVQELAKQAGRTMPQ